MPIEMAFAYLVTKWCIFKKPLECEFMKHKVVIILLIFASVILHKFCVDERLESLVQILNLSPFQTLCVVGRQTDL